MTDQTLRNAAAAAGTPRPDAPTLESREREWKAPLARFVVAVLGFETLTGLLIYLGPFGYLAQYGVLWHTVLGLALVVPFVWYQLRHWFMLRRQPLDHIKLLGYLSFLSAAVAIISGVVLTWQSAFSVRIGHGWDLAHVISGFTMSAVLLLHIVLVVVRTRRATTGERVERLRLAQRRFGWAALRLAGVMSAAVVACALLTPADRIYGEFAQDYSWRYGDNPYAPSLVRTNVLEAKKTIEPRAMADSRSCGTAGCHEDIVKEWLPSAHRYASMSKFFQAIQHTMAENNGAESTRYCAGCHDPVALFSGTKNIYSDDLSSYGADEGLTCVACHSIEKTDVKGNANYTIVMQQRYLGELQGGQVGKAVSDFLIRSFPRHHKASFSRPLYKTPEYCGACHKQFIDKDINNVGWVQLQNQYDNWRQSHWNQGDDVKKTVSCRECHMRLSPSSDPAAGDTIDYYRSAGDGQHRNHRFIGANQFHPEMHELPGAEEQVRLTEEWLRGETKLPEVAHKWTQGPAVPIDLVVPATVEAGKEARLKVVVTSNKVGHDFPTGPLDIIQSWLEVVVKDEQGNVVYETGKVDDKNFIQEGSAMFKAEGIDQNGHLIDRHNLWEMVGVRFRRNLFPGYSDSMEFKFACPDGLFSSGVKLTGGNVDVPIPAAAEGKTLTVDARLRYRKVDQTLINFLAGAKLVKEGLTSRITDISTAHATMKVVPASGAAELAPGPKPAVGAAKPSRS